MKTRLFTKVTVVFALSMLFFSCEDDDTDPSISSKGNCVLNTTVISSNNSSYATYSQTLDLKNTSSIYNNNSATEVEPTSSMVSIPYNGSIYNDKYMDSSVEKWDIDEEGSLIKARSISFLDLGYHCMPYFWNESVAFIGGPSTLKIAIFNPSTMQRTGFIDMTAYSMVGSVTNFPEAGDKIIVESPSEIIIRDNYMYIAMYYYDAAGTFEPRTNECTIIVVDLNEVDPNSSDNSNAIIKKITDKRGSYTGSWASGYGSSFMILDENNDIYLLCHNMWAQAGSVTNLPACILRICSGETDFDNDYYFDLEALVDNNPVIGLEYSGNGKFFAAVQNPDAIDTSNPYSVYLDPIYQWYQYDLYNKTATILNETFTKGSADSKCLFEDGYAYVPMSTTNESYIMKVDLLSLKSEKLFTTKGSPVLFKLK